MQDVMIHHGAYAHLLWLVFAVALVVGVGFSLRRRALGKFVSPVLRPLLLPTFSENRLWVKATLAVAALVAVVLGLVDIRWGRQWRDIPQVGVEVMFVLDVSRSMLATDTSPTRLDRAKQYIADVSDQLEGDRVGLFVFAGQPRQKVPLTSNYHDFAMTLNEVGPHSAPRGGSRLGEAITAAANAFVDTTPDHKAIVILTDGEDQASDPVEAARKAYENKGIVVYTVGLGDMDHGARIRLADNHYLEYDGHPVVTRMDGQVLKAVALAGGGAFVPAGTNWVDMGEVYRTHIGQIAARDFADARVQTWTPRYIWFAGLALVLLWVDAMVSDQRSRKSVAAPSVRALGFIVAGAMGMFLSASAWAQTAQEQVHQANIQLEAGDHAAALQAYRDVNQTIGESPQLAFNEAVALYRLGDFDAASQRLIDSLDQADPALRAKSRFNLGNIAYTLALKAKDEDRVKAIKQLQTAIIHYRDALDTAPHDTDARANIELAHRLIDQLKQEQQQQEQEQKQDQKKDQQKEKQKGSSQEKQDSSSSDSDNQDQKEPSSDQASSDAQKDAEQESQEKQDGDSQDAQSSQDQAKPDDLTQGKPQSANADEPSQDDKESSLSPQEAMDTMTPDEADKLLQAIRDKEYQRRARQQWLESQQQRPVEKDW